MRFVEREFVLALDGWMDRVVTCAVAEPFAVADAAFYREGVPPFVGGAAVHCGLLAVGGGVTFGDQSCFDVGEGVAKDVELTQPRVARGVVFDPCP